MSEQTGTAGTGTPGCSTANGGTAGGGRPVPPSKSLMLDLPTLGVDLAARVIDREGIARINPHRHEMSLLDAIVWKSADNRQGVAIWEVKEDEFWCRGHFPGKPMVPGVLQVEAGAQLSSFLYNIRFDKPRLAALTHIEDCSFRNPVVPGNRFYILCQELKFAPKRFSSRIQGMVDGKITFEASINGMVIG